MAVSNHPLELIHKSRNSFIYYQPQSEYGKPVVIKVVNATYPGANQLVRFNNEYEFTKDLAIEGVRKAISQTRLEDKPALILEYVSGQTLKQAFTTQKQSLIDFLQIAIAIAQTLGELHQHHIIHRDINSHNVLVNLETKQIKIIDFGLASRLDLKVQHLGNPEWLIGTLAYISPEQTGRMNRVVDYRTDLYSLGVTFYEMLTDRLPFEDEDPLALIHAHMATLPRPVTVLNSSVPSLVSDIVMKLLAKNAEDRYQSAFGLRADLERCLAAFVTDPKSAQKHPGLSFELGTDDYSGQFRIAQKLYGRSAETSTLLSAFERAAAGGRELVLVAGYAGVGKSALVAEIHKPITEKRGYFISGKFDKHQQNIPYAAFTQAFNQFADLLLTERETTLLQWQTRILTAVGNNGAILTEVIPSLEKVIGPQPPVLKLDGQENRNRFNLTFQNFVQAISTTQHPLAVFIDDWQWTDSASLELLKILMMDEANTCLLLIGAYRDNEVDQYHAFRQTLNDLSQGGAAIETIQVGNLQPEDVQQLIQESLGVSALDSRTLTELVYKKTQGNAFFTRQFLQNLYEEGWLQFDFNTRQWVWNIAQLEAQNITDNVVELMASKFKKLPPNTAHLLSLAACIGNEFDVQTLAMINQTSEAATLEQLSDTLVEGLLVPLDEYYQLPEMAAQAHFTFLHDRVQQAAYAQIPEPDRPSIHLSIGRLLLANTIEPDLESRVFDIVQHYNLAQTLITDEAEKLQVVALNMQAADLAYGAAAFNSAQAYLETALALMPDEAWINHYDQMLKIHSQLAQILALTGDFDQLEQIFQVTKAQAHTIAETAQATQAKIQALMSQGNFPEILEVGVNFLEALGISLNRAPSPNEAIQYLNETAEWLTDVRIESIPQLPEAPPEEGVILQFALALYSPTFVANPPLFMILNSRLTRLIVEKGLVPEAAAALINFGVLICSVLNDVPKGRRLTTIVRDLVEERFPVDSLLSFVYTITNGFVVHRYDHLKNTIPLLTEGAQKGMNSGNFEFAGYAIWDIAWHQLFLGVSLDRVAIASKQAVDACQKMQRVRVKDTCLLVHQATLNLQGKSKSPWILKGDGYDEEVSITLAFQGNDFAEVFRIFFYKAWLHYLFDYPKEAVDFFQDAEPYLLHTAGVYLVPLFYFYDSLANAATYTHQNPQEQTQILDRINRNLEAFEIWVRFAPMNHQHKKDLIEAEKARLEGKHWEAFTAYQKAIQGARDNEFLHEEALANELCGQFWVEQNNNEIARIYLGRALNIYNLWGARAKIEQLQGKYEHVLSIQPSPQQSVSDTVELISTSQPVSPTGEAIKSWLDMGSVLKANQTLSQAVQLSDLLTEMINILLENAGAERVLIMYQEEDTWFIQAEGRVQDSRIQTEQRIPVLESGLLSLNVFNYVVRSGTAVVLANAAQDSQFAADTYLTEQKIKSVLCLPIWHQGQLKLVLYLENNLTEAAFTEERLELLQMLSVQMAISLENALLVNNLQTSIAERERVEEALRLTRFSMDNVADAVYWMDSEANIVDVNETACLMLGYTHTELTQMSVPDIDPLFPIERWAGTWQYVKEHGRLTLETQHCTKDGRIIPVELIANFIQFGDQELNCAIVRDITERKQAEQALQRKTEELNRFFTVALDLLCIADTDGYFRRLNPQWEVVLGYSLSELEGRRFLDLVHPDDRASTLSVLAELSAQKVVVDFVNRYRCQDGSYRWIEWRSYPAENLVYAAARDITERRQAELDLQERNRFIDAILENAPIGFAVNTVNDGEIVFASNRFAEIYGVPPGSIHSVDEFFEVVYPDPVFREQLREQIAADIASGDPLCMSWENIPVTTSTGEHKFVTATNIPLWEQDLMISTVQDVTEQKRAEEALRESEFFLRKSQVVAQIGSYYFDIRVGQWISSPALDEIFGIDDSFSKDVEGWIAVVHPEDKEEMFQYLNQSVLTEYNRFDKEYRIIRYDNQQERWVHGLGELEFDEYGNAIKMIGTIQDITERKQVEAELRASEVRYRALVESQMDLISRYRLDTTLTFVNDAYCQFYGKTREELVGKSYLIMVAPEFHEQALEETENFKKDPSPIRGEYLNYRWDGQECWIHWILQGIEDENGQVVEVQATGRDVTPLKQAEEEIRRLNTELEQRVIKRTAQLEAANKELEAFSYSVSHDLRAPLRAIDGYTRILIEDYEPVLDDEGKRICNIIGDQTRQMGKLIDDLLTFSRLSRTEMRLSSIDMEALAGSVFQELTTPEMRERIDFQLGSISPTVGDQALIRQVWVNLLSNAVKFSSKKEQVVIIVSGKKEENKTIYSIQDNGAGFDMQYADKLFGVFQRLHSEREFEGTGVGLAIVQRIIQRHGGRVWAESTVDHGATFYFTLPLERKPN